MPHQMLLQPLPWAAHGAPYRCKHLNAGDWMELAALYNIHAPLSVDRPQDAIAAAPVDHAEPASDTFGDAEGDDGNAPVDHPGGLPDVKCRPTEDDICASVIHLACHH